MQPRKYYVDVRGGRATYSHKEAVAWLNQGADIDIYVEDPVTGELTQGWITGWRA